MMVAPADTRTSSSFPATRARSSRERPAKIDVRVIVSMNSSTPVPRPTRIARPPHSGPRISAPLASGLTLCTLRPRVGCCGHDGGRTMKLKDKIALVTGGGSGLGRAIALLFSEEGAHVVVNELRLETAEQTVASMKGPAGGRAVEADVDDSSQARATFPTIERQLGTPG